ncbi:MAG: hypothetical protein ACTHMZ_10505 [Actinomycetes bacterium]
MPVAWHWRFERGDGTDITASLAGGEATTEGGALSVRPAADGFPTQSDAESWLGETWRELLAAGVDQVRLYEDGAEVYGPMSLHSPE